MANNAQHDIRMEGNVVTITLAPTGTIMRNISEQFEPEQAAMRQHIVDDIRTGLSMLEQFDFGSPNSITEIIDPAAVRGCSDDMRKELIADKFDD